MADRPPLTTAVSQLVGTARQIYANTPQAAAVDAIGQRLHQPLRVAIAGKVKAGKSTLLNALVGQELAPTDAGECTKIITWYRDGVVYRATVFPRHGRPYQTGFTHDAGAVDIDLGGLRADEVSRLELEWPSRSLAEMTLIDTPGIAGLDSDAARNVLRFLDPDTDPPADAVLYLMRHVHSADIRFLESFHDVGHAEPTPINSIGVMSRADDLGAGRLDALETAERITARYRQDQKLRRLCQTVLPVAGLLAQAAVTLRENEYQALKRLASLPDEELDHLLLSADRFGRERTSDLVSASERLYLLERLGLFGVRLSLHLLRTGRAATSGALASELRNRSGLPRLREVLTAHFAARSEVLKAKAALLAVDRLGRHHPAPGCEQLLDAVERVAAGAHEFAEVRLLNEVWEGSSALSADEQAEVERLLAGDRDDPVARLGLDPAATDQQVADAAVAAIHRWSTRAENPLATREVRDSAGVMVHSYESVFAAAHRSAQDPVAGGNAPAPGPLTPAG